MPLARLDDHLLDVVDSEAKAYLLGWIAARGTITPRAITISGRRDDGDTLTALARAISRDATVKPLRTGQRVGLALASPAIAAAVGRWLDVAPPAQPRAFGFPAFADDRLGWGFVRGMFDSVGTIASVTTVVRGGSWPAPRCVLASPSPRLVAAIAAFAKVPATLTARSIEWSGTNALDLLGKLYDRAALKATRKYECYLEWCHWTPPHPAGQPHPVFRWTKILPAARPPSKASTSDSGFDLTLIERDKTHGMVEFYRTGIRVQPAFGWYFDLVPRSSITKSGYMLANSVGVIDRAYTGEILVPLIKIDPTAPTLALPARLVQIIPRPIIAPQLVEVDELDGTMRGAGGFGSSGA